MPPTPPTDPTVTPDIGTTTGPVPKPSRVLACILCQQRKVRCDRIFPCANCVRQGAVCVPAGQIPRERRKRFPEKALLERLRYYEGLLRQNRIQFVPLHNQDAESDDAQCNTSEGHLFVEHPESPTSASREAGKEPEHTAGNKYFLKRFSEFALDNNVDTSSDDVSDVTAGTQPENFPKTKMMMSYSHDIHADFTPVFLYGLPDLVPLTHPEKHLLLKLWQIFLQNVHPTMNVIHVPTFQAHVYDVAHSTSGFAGGFSGEPKRPSLVIEALLFSVYSVAVRSLSDHECQTQLSAEKHKLLSIYQGACQQAIRNCDALSINSRDSLTAIFLHIVSIGTRVKPETLHTMLGPVIRLATRLGIYRESIIEKYDVVEAEMCRRLWWAIVKFDHRICEIVCYQSTPLVLAWDCKTPSNIPDSELVPGMQTATSTKPASSEALFCALCAEFYNTVRQQKPDLGFPLLKSGPKVGSMIASLVTLESMAETKYFSAYDDEDPLQFLTRWCFRYSVALAKISSLYLRPPREPSGTRSEADLGELFQYARDAIEASTRMMGHLPIRRYLWMSGYWPPGVAWMTLLRDMKRHPEKDHVQDLWNELSENRADLWNELSENRAVRQDYHQCMGLIDRSIKALSHVVLETWRANDEFSQSQGRKLRAPPMIKEVELEIEQEAMQGHKPQPPMGPGSNGSFEGSARTAGHDAYSFAMSGIDPGVEFSSTEYSGFDNQSLMHTGWTEGQAARLPNHPDWSNVDDSKSLPPWKRGQGDT
ncbi:hypothetical protein PG985_013583 [Apiospora marii]|uniref:uncharacterized protein n=1 Tax=Apiospora marii TaxID=335849 RepID=UPI003130E1DE